LTLCGSPTLQGRLKAWFVPPASVEVSLHPLDLDSEDSGLLLCLLDLLLQPGALALEMGIQPSSACVWRRGSWASCLRQATTASSMAWALTERVGQPS